MSENKQRQLTHYFSPTLAAEDVSPTVVDALCTNEDGSKNRVWYNISVWEGNGELSRDQEKDNERGNFYLDAFKDAVKVGTSSQMDYRHALSRETVKHRLPDICL